MTDAQIRKMQRQLQAGADGYLTLRRAVAKSVDPDSSAGSRAIENMERMHRELQEFADREPPEWLRLVKL